MKIERFICDIDKCENTAYATNKTFMCIRKTDTTEGRPIKGYTEIVSLDICAECLDSIIQGFAIFAYGAQGFDTFEIQNPKKLKRP